MQDCYKETLRTVRDATRKTVKNLVLQALRDALGSMTGSSSVVHDRDARLLMDSQQAVADAFVNRISQGFDDLVEDRKEESKQSDFGSLSLMEENELESVIALEGMITHARNCDITEYLRFSTRLNDLFHGKIIDESNNPLDPAQIGEAMKLSLEPIGLTSAGQLVVYRKFNQQVFHNLETVLKEANGLLKGSGVLPGLSVSGRDKEDLRTRRSNARTRIDPEERAFSLPAKLEPITASPQHEVFTLIQGLLHKDIHNVATSSPVHDAIEVTDLMFRAIWDDVTVPETIRRLLGRTSLTVLKVVLSDKKFWCDSSHPARVLLNELAEAKKEACLTAEIEEDPVFQKARDIVSRFVSGYEDDNRLIAKLVRELQDEKQKHASIRHPDEDSKERVKNIAHCRQRLESAQRLAEQKLQERIENRKLPEFLRQLLEQKFKCFLVELILAQGAGGDCWKPVMKTVDLLLWSVQAGKSEQDREKLKMVNVRLMSNMKKALAVAKMNSSEIDDMLWRIREVQNNSFGKAVREDRGCCIDHRVDEILQSDTLVPQIKPEVPVEQRYLTEAVTLPVGVWMKFIVDGSHSIICTMAAKISERDTCVFVNRQGVKVLEKSYTDLARELAARSATIVSDGVLVDRAIDTVIARLRARNEKRVKANPELNSAA